MLSPFVLLAGYCGGLFATMFLVLCYRAFSNSGDFYWSDAGFIGLWFIAVPITIVAWFLYLAEALRWFVVGAVRSWFRHVPTKPVSFAKLSLKGAICRVCGEGFNGQPVHTCEACSTPHHSDCWEYNGRCGVYGCRGLEWLSVQSNEIPPTQLRNVLAKGVLPFSVGVFLFAVTLVGLYRHELDEENRLLQDSFNITNYQAAAEIERNARSLRNLGCETQSLDPERSGWSERNACASLAYLSVDRFLEFRVQVEAEREQELPDSMTAKARLDARLEFLKMIEEMR